MTALPVQQTQVWRNPSVQERHLLAYGLSLAIGALYESRHVDVTKGLSAVQGLLSPHPFLEKLDALCVFKHNTYIKKTHSALLTLLFRLMFQFDDPKHRRALFPMQPTFDASWRKLVENPEVVCHFFVTLHGLLVFHNCVPFPSEECSDFYTKLYDFLDKPTPYFEEKIRWQFPHFDAAVQSAFDTFRSRHLYQGVNVVL